MEIHEIQEFILIGMNEWTESFKVLPPTQIIFIDYKEEGESEYSGEVWQSPP